MTYSLDTTVKYITNLFLLEFQTGLDIVVVLVNEILNSLKLHDYIRRWMNGRNLITLEGRVFRNYFEKNSWLNSFTYNCKIASLRMYKYSDFQSAIELETWENEKNERFKLVIRQDKTFFQGLIVTGPYDWICQEMSKCEVWQEVLKLLNKFVEF